VLTWISLPATLIFDSIAGRNSVSQDCTVELSLTAGDRFNLIDGPIAVPQENAVHCRHDLKKSV
jgi:hypothetical protein